MRRFLDVIPTQPLRYYPFDYVVIDDVLPEDVFLRVVNSLPSFELISSQIKPEEGQYNNRLVVPFCVLKEHADASVWDAIEAAMLSDEFEELLISLFSGLMDTETQKRLSQPISRGVKLNCDPAGSYLKPHTDSPEILLSFFIYLRSGTPHPSLDTVLYEPVNAEDRLSRIRNSEYSHEEFSDHRRVDHIEFKPNRAFCFLRTWDSVHGIEPVADSAGQRYAVSFRLKSVVS